MTKIQVGRPRLGCHISLGRKPGESLAAAHAQGVSCVQIFASSPGAWKAPMAPTDKTLAAWQQCGIDVMFIHAIYLINLASTDEVLRTRSIESLVRTLYAASAWGASGVVTHIGSHSGRGFDQTVDLVANSIEAVLQDAPSGVGLVLENSAGAGGIIGSSLLELAQIFDATGRHPSLQVALDTAHLCGAGWDLREPKVVAQLVEELESSIGADRLVLIHANDSKAECGSRRDRHATIGQGHVGLAGFRQMLQEPALCAVPWILETPDLAIGLPAEERFSSLRTLWALIEEA